MCTGDWEIQRHSYNAAPVFRLKLAKRKHKQPKTYAKNFRVLRDQCLKWRRSRCGPRPQSNWVRKEGQSFKRRVGLHEHVGGRGDGERGGLRGAYSSTEVEPHTAWRWGWLCSLPKKVDLVPPCNCSVDAAEAFAIVEGSSEPDHPS